MDRPNKNLYNPYADDAAGIPPPIEERNSGRTGSISADGSRAEITILSCESQEAFDEILRRWCATYQPEPDSLEFDFVLKTVQAEWSRIRCQRNYNDFTNRLGDRQPFDWTAEEIKLHDLHLRYKTAAERGFQRDYRTLEQHYKSHQPKPKPEPQPKTEAVPETPKRQSRTRITTTDPTSPTGYKCLYEYPPQEGVTYPCPTDPPPPGYSNPFVNSK
jgi:hypothetical protein